MEIAHRLTFVICGIAGFWIFPAGAQLNSWTNPASANWENNHWSLGSLPNASQSVFITNAGYKAVGIFSSTVSSYPASLTVSNLTIAAPSDALSTLLLNYVGTSVPLRILGGCEVDTNGSLINEYSALEIDGGNGGQFNIRGGTVTAQGGTLSVSNDTHVSGGRLQLTNGAANFSRVFVESDGSTTGRVTQTGAAVNGAFLIADGSYELTSGILTGAVTVGYSGSGQMIQHGGTNFGGLTVSTAGPYYSADGEYDLYGGAIINSGIRIADSSYCYGAFLQFGGYVQTPTLFLGNSANSHGSYTISDGLLNAGALSLFNSTFNQSGGQVTLGATVSVYGTFDDYAPPTFSSISLSGGVLTMPGLTVGLFGDFEQSGGSNIVETLAIDKTTCGLSGGFLNAGSVFISGGYLVLSDGNVRKVGELRQSGGTNYVSNLLSVGDEYELQAGLLYASNITVTGTLIVSSDAARVTNPGTITLGGTLQLLGTTQSFGSLTISNDSVVDFWTNASTVRFLPSGIQAWAARCVLTITNWQGNTNGGGITRFFAGTNGNGLNGAQLAQIAFANPAGFPPGIYGARILATGEIVPTENLPLNLARVGQQLVLTWPGAFTLQSATNVSGPFSDLEGVSSPFTNPVSNLPKQFFRLRH